MPMSILFSKIWLDMFIAEKSSRTVLKIPYPKIIRLLSNCLEFETLIHFFQLIKSVFNFSFLII